MLKMGFGTKWVDWIMQCVESVHYSVLINSDLVVPVTPKRGLRQGEPLSPYLFFLCSEGRSALLHHEVSNEEIHGVQIGRNAPIYVNPSFYFEMIISYFSRQKRKKWILLDIFFILMSLLLVKR